MTRKLQAVPDPESVTPDTTEVSDVDIAAAIQEEFANRQPVRPKTVTISELFQQSVALVASATGRRYPRDIPRVTEANAVKLYELTLMWALNQRNNPSHDILPSDEIGSEAALPTPNETIGATPDQES